jgi:hypothetical protein
MAEYRGRHSRVEQADAPFVSGDVTARPVPHGRNQLFKEHANNPTLQAWMRDLLDDYVPADAALRGFWQGRLRNTSGANPNDGPFEASLLDFVAPHVVTGPYVSYNSQGNHVGCYGYRAGGPIDLDPVSSGASIKTTGKVVTFLASSSIGSSLQYGFREYLQDIERTEVQDGVGYAAYIIEPPARGGNGEYSMYSALSMPNRNIRDDTRGRPGVSSTFWTTGEVGVDELVGLAARDYPAEVAQARADSPYGEIAINGLAVVVLT